MTTFNSVALALSMLDESSLGASRLEFDQVKQLIETALQGTVDDHYESFATAITMHNSVLQSLTTAQTSVSGARRRLRDSREALGAKRADLVQMWQRSQAVKEALKLLDLVEHLKSVPDKLESLMAEKHFLESVNLLVRSLKTIDKPEVVEVGATNDLRAYLKGQEQAMLEILIEELHNHLYLKSYFAMRDGRVTMLDRRICLLFDSARTTLELPLMQKQSRTSLSCIGWLHVRCFFNVKRNIATVSILAKSSLSTEL